VGAGAVALRGSRRWVQGYAPVPLPAPADPGAGLRERGVYLVTGGLGGVGISLAAHMAERARARLVLVSRSSLPPRERWAAHLAAHGTASREGRAIAAIRRMEAAGAEVLVAAADVCDPAALRAVREQALARFGRVDGIVHAAGVAGGGMAEVRTRDQAERVLAPKLRGVHALRETFADLDLDFVLLCSSLTALVGSFGQVDYCAANAYLDAYARSAHGWRCRLLSVDWAAWLELGMAAEVEAPAGFRALQRGDRVSPLDHPILSLRHDGDGTDLPWFSGSLSAATHWVLDEHRIAGVPVMPLTAYVEFVRAAFEAAVPAPSPGHAVELRDVAVVEPMSVPDGATAELQVQLTPGSGGLEFVVASVVEGQTRTHAVGGVAWVSPPAAAPVDLAAVRARCARVTGERAGMLPTTLLTFGPRWRNLRERFQGERDALARLEAPDQVAAELDRWALHPAVLDDATSFTRVHRESHYLPIGYGRMLVRRPMPARTWSHLRRHPEGAGEVLVADFALLDEDGREVLAVTDFLLRRIDPDDLAASLSTGAGRPPAAIPAPGAAEGIPPATGAEAFHRLVASSLGPQVTVSPLPLDQLLASARRVTQETVTERVDSAAAAGPAAAPATRAGYVAPRTELEATIARLWTEVLGTAVGVEDSFLELGGNSLIAVQLIALVRRALGVRLPMRRLFDAPTVTGVAVLVEELRRAAGPAEAPEPAPAPAIPRLARTPR
jgi:NAD(P)-dependent dehydrogenase (short-subunit alcohol dehydrogenase family)/acyl carrier protein